jgi:hypothetical protein
MTLRARLGAQDTEEIHRRPFCRKRHRPDDLWGVSQVDLMKAGSSFALGKRNTPIWCQKLT